MSIVAFGYGLVPVSVTRIVVEREATIEDNEIDVELQDTTVEVELVDPDNPV